MSKSESESTSKKSNKKLILTFSLIIFLVGVFAPIFSPVYADWTDVPYATKSSAQKLDIYLPSTGSGPFPVIVAIHGGGFMMGDKAEEKAAISARDSGYAVASINYRLSGEAIFPAQIQDVKAAIRFLRANASKYNLNPDKIATWGGSAGGNLASLAGTSGGVAALEDLTLGNESYSSTVQAVVDWFGPINFSTMDTQFTTNEVPKKTPGTTDGATSPESKLIGAEVGTNPALVAKANPETYISADDPPFFIQHGTLDGNVPTQQSRDFYANLIKVLPTDKVNLTILEGAGHGGDAFNSAENVAKVVAFLDKYLKNGGSDNGETKAYKILTNTSPECTIPTGAYIQVIGSNGGNTIKVESGARVECLNFPGLNVINIQEASTGFKVYRSGATVYLESTAGTKIRIPATLTAQTLVFTDGSSNLQIAKDKNKVMIGDQEITRTTMQLAMPVNPIEPNTNTTYTIVDTEQAKCYNDLTEITCPLSGSSFYGQDSQHTGNAPSYTNNGDGTIADNVTGLMWQQSPDMNNDGLINVDDKMTYSEAVAGAANFNLAGYTDWRLPTIKELYSLILFNGTDPSGYNGTSTSGLIPFIDTKYFVFEYGDTSAGERIIDAQFASSTKYVSTTMNGSDTMFGVNFADGRIKGYGTEPMPGQTQGKTFFVLYVRGNSDYGKNHFKYNGDGTITDSATKLMWTQDDSGTGMNWAEALDWVEQKNSEKYLGYSDWRLPNAKELQSIVDYTRSPDTTSSAAIDSLFNISSITNEAGKADYPFYWTGTTHANWNTNSGGSGAYIAFGRGLGYMNGSWIDVHGAGCQRSDPKAGNSSDYPTGHGPQGDAIRIYNYVRCVRN